MGLHPYPFKWRWPPHFPGLLVMIIRHMRKAKDLDIKIGESVSTIERLENELRLLKGEFDSIKDKLKKGKDRRAEDLKREVNQKIRDIGRKIDYFCKSVKAELKDFERNDIDDYTLLYRGSRYLGELAKLLVASKNINERGKEELKKIIMAEMRGIKSKADALELQAKYLERGVANTVVLSQISPLGNGWIEGRIRVKAIEISHLYDILKNKKGENLPQNFEKMISDIYEIGRNTNMLMRRLKITFNSVKTKLRERGIYSPQLDETQHFFNATFNRIERIGKRLENEMNDQAANLESRLKQAT